MHLQRFEVHGLFGHLNHSVDFPVPDQDDPKPTLRILHGQNGVGKTTVLRMLDALLGENDEHRYQVFAEVPFHECALWISGIDPVYIRNQGDALEIEFAGQLAHLSKDKAKGGRSSFDLLGAERDGEAELRRAFENATKDISFEFIQTSRIVDSAPEQDASLARYQLFVSASTLRRRQVLAERMKAFIANAQLNSSSFFASRQPYLFQKVITRLTEKRSEEPATVDQLLKGLRAIRQAEQGMARFGLSQEEWDFEELSNVLRGLPTREGEYETALLITEQYVEVLRTSVAFRSLVARRLRTFEEVMNDFLKGKEVRVSSKDGFTILSADGTELEESQLSSGERHLLYLVASATLTRRQGTIVAIDEPELSMHVSWQRKLVAGLTRCAAFAAPLFILATHSLDVAAEYRSSLVELTAE